MTESPFTLERFIAALRLTVEVAVDEADLLAQMTPLVRRFASETHWRRPDMYHADTEQGFGTTVLHVEADQSLFVVVDSWLPGRGVQPHDHDTWAVVAGLEGIEYNRFWQRLDDGRRPGHARLRCSGERQICPGEVLTMPRGAIHSVSNPGERTSLSLHVYGRHLNYTARRRFDPERELEQAFRIDTR